MVKDYADIDLVMLVDDNDTDNFISRRIIEITNFASKVEIKNSGKSALEYLEDNKDKSDKKDDSYNKDKVESLEKGKTEAVNLTS